MLPYIVRRLVVMFGMLVALSIITFLLFYALPRDPARLICGVHCTPDSLRAYREELGLDVPLVQQYLNWIHAIFFGKDISVGPFSIYCQAPCFGFSQDRGEMVFAAITRVMPVTAYLALGAFILWMSVGVTTGILAARFKGSIFDRGVMITSLIGFSLPSFFIGLSFMIFVVVYWQLVPYPDYKPPTEDFGKFFSAMILPWITLAILYAAYYTRLTRSQMLDTMNEDFIRTARAKGLPEKVVVRKHAFRAGLTPIVTSAGLDLAGLLGGAIITERIFGLSGLGSVAITAVTKLDLPMLVAITLLGAVFIVVANLIVDILYAVIDPRVRIR
ncbi:MAG: ABC transporter permease [Actinomycetales bacterium]|nr:ABC transporter permease [Actinomycetales bacterium]